MIRRWLSGLWAKPEPDFSYTCLRCRGCDAVLTVGITPSYGPERLAPWICMYCRGSLYRLFLGDVQGRAKQTQVSMLKKKHGGDW